MGEAVRVALAYLVFYERSGDETAARAFVAFASEIPAGSMHLIPTYDPLALRESWNLQGRFVTYERAIA
jgi:hypothetical protein